MITNRRYALGLSALAALTVISPLIVVSLPILVLLGPAAVILLRNAGSRVGHVWSAAFSIAVFTGPSAAPYGSLPKGESGPNLRSLPSA